MLSNNILSKSLKYSLQLFLFLLPWQTVWIYRELFIQGAKWQYGTLTFYATEILLWFIVFLFIGWYLQKSKLFSKAIEFSWSKDRMFLFTCLLFIIYCFLSLFWSLDPNLALQSSLWILEALLIFLVISVGPVSSMNLAPWFIAGGAVQGILALAQFFFQSTFSLSWLGLAAHPVGEAGVSVVENNGIGRWLRAYGSFAHPNILGGYLTFCLIVLLSFFSNKIFSQRYKNVLFLLSSICLVIGIVFSFSRAAWLVSVSALLFLPLHARLERELNFKTIVHSIFPALATFLLLIVALFPLVQTRLTIESRLEQQSVEQRITGLEVSSKIISDNLLFGVGIGNYTAELIRLIPDKPGWFYQPVHNVFALIFAEIGLVGWLLLSLVFISWVYFLFYSHDVPPRVVYFVSVVIFSLFVIGSLDHYLVSSYTGWIVLGVCFGFISKMELEQVDKR